MNSFPKVVFTRIELKTKSAETLINKIDGKTKVLIANTAGTSAYEYYGSIRGWSKELLTILVGTGTDDDIKSFQQMLEHKMDYQTFTPVYFAEILVKCWENILKVEKSQRVTLFANDYVREYAKGLIEASKK
jgi:hypothetical protein